MTMNGVFPTVCQTQPLRWQNLSNQFLLLHRDEASQICGAFSNSYTEAMHRAHVGLSHLCIVPDRRQAQMGSMETNKPERNDTMKSLFKSLSAAAHKRAAYTRTVAEISNLPLHVAQDLNIFASDAKLIASRAVYGA